MAVKYNICICMYLIDPHDRVNVASPSNVSQHLTKPDFDRIFKVSREGDIDSKMLINMWWLRTPKCWNMFDVDRSPKCWNNMFNILAEP